MRSRLFEIFITLSTVRRSLAVGARRAMTRGLFLDLFFQRVDGLVAAAHLLGQFLVAGFKRLGRVP
jgi:hypothetical protein